jgi:hypothetical protein
MGEDWKKQDRPCAPCPDCGAELYEKFWGNGGWAKTDKATDRTHGADDCVKRLRELLHRDRTGLAEAISRMVKEAAGRMWVTDGRGCYEWDDDRYKEEAGDALRAVIEVGKKALLDSGTIVGEAFGPRALVPQK